MWLETKNDTRLAAGRGLALGISLWWCLAGQSKREGDGKDFLLAFFFFYFRYQ